MDRKLPIFVVKLVKPDMAHCSAVWTNPETSVAALGAIQLLIGHLQITDSTTGNCTLLLTFLSKKNG